MSAQLDDSPSPLLSVPSVNRGIHIQHMAKQFMASAIRADVYRPEEILPLVGLPRSRYLQPEQVGVAVDLEHAFEAFKGAMVDPIDFNKFVRRKIFVVENTGNLEYAVTRGGMQGCKNGFYAGSGIVGANMARYNSYNNRLNGEDLSNPAKFVSAMSRALFNEVVAHGKPVIVSAHAVDEPEIQQFVGRLHAHSYETVYRDAFPGLENAI